MTEIIQEPMQISKKKAFFLELRAPFLTASISPVFLGTAIAWATTGVFLLDVFLLTVIAGAFLHIAANVSNDYFDHTPENTGSDDINTEFVRPFTGGSRMIQLGLLTPREVLAESMVFFAITGLIGVYLALTRGILILVFGMIGAASGLFYSAPPFRLVKRGIGEIFIGLNFGVLMVLGSYYVQAQNILLEPILASIPTALLVAGILYINEFQDYAADRDSGKRTVVVRLGREKAAKGYAVLIAAVFVWIVVCVVSGLIAFESLLALTLIPLGYLGVRIMMREYEAPNRLVPANAATIMLHLLITLSLTAGYILKGFTSNLIYLAIAGIVLVVICAIQYRNLTRPPPAM